MPSLFVRKRNNGDTQAVLQTRTWGIGSSARSLVYADDLLLTALIGNDNNIGAPRWGLVAPEEIERVDFLYGPFSAQYPGNSMGGVLKITTRMPEKLEVSVKDTVSVQDFHLWGTNKSLRKQCDEHVRRQQIRGLLLHDLRQLAARFAAAAHLHDHHRAADADSRLLCDEQRLRAELRQCLGVRRQSQ